MLKIAPNGQMYVLAPTSPPYGKSNNRRKGKEKQKEKPPATSPPVIPRIYKYINPKVDWAFKHLFGKGNERFLKSLMDAIFDGQKKFGTFTYLDKEYTGNTLDDRTSIFDLMISDSKKQNFLIECQIAYQEFFMKRLIFYMAKFLSTQGKKGKWNHNFHPITGVCITDFESPDEENNPNDNQYIKKIGLFDEDNQSPKLDDCSIFTVDLKNFKKSEDELETMLDKWLYLLKYLPFMKERPAIFKETIFKEFFKEAEFMKLTKEDREKYTVANKKASDQYAQITTAEKNGMNKGMEIGMEKGRKEERKILKLDFVRSLLQKTGLSMAEIAELAKVPMAMVRKISKEEVCV